LADRKGLMASPRPRLAIRNGVRPTSMIEPMIAAKAEAIGKVNSGLK
jgi:hypothetical protein